MKYGRLHPILNENHSHHHHQTKSLKIYTAHVAPRMVPCLAKIFFIVYNFTLLYALGNRGAINIISKYFFLYFLKRFTLTLGHIFHLANRVIRLLQTFIDSLSVSGSIHPYVIIQKYFILKLDIFSYFCFSLFLPVSYEKDIWMLVYWK